jgi:hypothetical protein
MDNGATVFNGKPCVLEIADIIECDTGDAEDFITERMVKLVDEGNFFYAYVDIEGIPGQRPYVPPVSVDVLIPATPSNDWQPTDATLVVLDSTAEPDYDDSEWVVATITEDTISFDLPGTDRVAITITGASRPTLAKALHAALAVVFE